MTSSSRPIRQLLLALYLILTCTSLGRAQETSSTGLPPWTRFKLANGLEVVVVENHLTPIATIEIAVRNGSFTESSGYNGLSHLYEHMFFTANKRDTTENQFLGRVDRLGIVYNGTTREEVVNYYFTLPKERLVDGMDFMATAITSPLFKEDELRKQREVVLGEFDRNEANPFFRFTRKMNHALWGAWQERKEQLGQRTTIRSATREKMLAIKAKYYVPNNSLLIVAGDVRTNEVRALAEQYFSAWRAGPDPFATDPPKRVPPLERSLFVLDTVDQPGVSVQVSWHGPSIGLDDKATYVADVFSYIITQQQHRFEQALVESGLAQRAGFGYYTQRYVGPISASLFVTPMKLDTAMKVFWREVAKFADTNYYTQEEFETSKNYLRTETMYRSVKLSDFAHDIGFWWSTAGLDYYEHYLEDLSKITRQDITDYVRRYIQGQPYVLGMAMSKPAAIITEPSLKRYGRP